jgi:hypothetical protein
VRYKSYEKSDTSSYGSISCTTLLVSNSMSESYSLVSNQKSSDSSENASLSSSLSKNCDTSSSVSRSFYHLLFDAAIFTVLDHR